jgi:hypothetical protein
VVTGNAVKPAVDEKGLVMIPLEKQSKSKEAEQTVCVVEFVYLSKVRKILGIFLLGYRPLPWERGELCKYMCPIVIFL